MNLDGLERHQVVGHQKRAHEREENTLRQAPGLLELGCDIGSIVTEGVEG